MKNEKRALLRPGDLIVALCMILAAVLPFMPALFRENPNGPASVMVSEDAIITRYPLSENRTVNLSGRGYDLLLILEDGTVRIQESSCPGGDCVASGRISRPGQSIVCLPAHVIVSIEGGAPDADIILG